MSRPLTMPNSVDDPPTVVVDPPLPPAPRLENGDHLTRHEFERRYEAMPRLKKAELIEGVVFIPSPVRHTQHGMQHLALSTWLGTYCSATPGMTGGNNSTVRLDLDNEPQPDALMMIEQPCGGQARVDAEGYIAGVPELVAEVSASSVSIDRNTKLRVYRRNSVQEYLIWRVLDQEIDWFVLRQGQYCAVDPSSRRQPAERGFSGAVARRRRPGADRSVQVLRVLQRGLASAEHAAFVNTLATRRASAP